MWLLKKLAPDFKTIADFRKGNKQAIKRVCREFILLCKKLDLFSGEFVAIDRNKFKAVNSKKRNFNQQKLNMSTLEGVITVHNFFMLSQNVLFYICNGVVKQSYSHSFF